MTRIYSVAYTEHLKFTPDPVDSPTKNEPNRQIEQAEVDAWRTGVKTVAVVDGWAEEAIAKVKTALAQTEDVKSQRVVEVGIVGVTLQGEAE